MSPMGVASVEFIDPREPIAVCLFPETLLFSVFFFSLQKVKAISCSWLL